MAFILNSKKRNWYNLLLVSLFSLAILLGCSFDCSIDAGKHNEGSAPPHGCAGQYYTYDLNNYFYLSKFKQPVKYQNTGGSLPPGLSLNQNLGIISGKPQKTGKWKFNIKVTDSSSTPEVVESDIIIYIHDFSIITGFLLPQTCINKPYSAVIHLCGGTPPFKWQIKDWKPGAQPLTFSAAQTTVRYNTIAGTPNKCDGCEDLFPWRCYQFTVAVTDKNNPTPVEKKFKIDVTNTLTVLSPVKLPTGYVGKSYTYNLQACGGSPPYKWKRTKGKLPPGLSLSIPGKIDGGSPTAAGNFHFTLELTDLAPPSDVIPSGVFNIRVMAAPLTLVGKNFTLLECVSTLLPIGGASGGQGTRFWQLKSGETLPPGISLRSDGNLYGQPAKLGTFPFTVQIFDATTDLTNPPSAKITVQVNPYPHDTSGIVVERFRHAGYGDPTYLENEIHLNYQKKVKVDFRITDPVWASTWKSLAAGKKQVTLKILGICSADKITNLDEMFWDADSDGVLEYQVRYDIADFTKLVNAAGGKQKSPFDFRILVENLENSTKLVKIFKNVKIK